MSMFRFKGLGDGILLGAGVPGAGSRTRNTIPCRIGTICATGVWRSITAIVSPRRTARRYSLSRDLRSAIPTFFMTIL